MPLCRNTRHKPQPFDRAVMPSGHFPATSLPPVSRWRFRLFARYVTWYLRRNFHALHLLQLRSLESLRGHPVLISVNHPSWWDPLICLYLSTKFFSERTSYGPIAVAGVAKYKFMERLGFFSIEKHSRAGAEKFLRLGQQCLSSSKYALWVTPQGEFVDVRQRPVTIAAGVGHLARRLTAESHSFYMLPVALEYAFWNERYPEAFVGIGEPLLVSDHKTAAEWSALFATALERTQNELSARVTARDAGAFAPLLEGRAGVGGAYDLWRSLKARAQGRRFEAEHGGA